MINESKLLRIGIKSDSTPTEAFSAFMDWQEKQTATIIEKTKGDLEAFKKGIDELKAEVAETTKAVAEAMQSKAQKSETLLSQIQRKAEEVVKLGESNSNGKVKMHIGAEHFMLKTYLPASVTDNTLAFRVPGYGQKDRTPNRVMDEFTMIPLSAGLGGAIRYVDQLAFTNNAASVAQGATIATPSELTHIEKAKPLQRVHDKTKVSRYMLTDFVGLQAEMVKFVEDNLFSKIDTLMMSGTGTGVQPEGLYTNASTFTAPAEGLVNAYYQSLFLKVMLSGASASSKYMYDKIFVSEDTMFKMLEAKGTDGHYVNIPYAGMRGMDYFIRNAKVIDTTTIATNTALVVDSRRQNFYFDGTGVTVELGFEGTDFSERIVTMVADFRLELLRRSVDAKSAYKIADLEAALTTLKS